MQRSVHPSPLIENVCICNSVGCASCSLRLRSNRDRRFAIMVLVASLGTSLAITSLTA